MSLGRDADEIKHAGDFFLEVGEILAAAGARHVDDVFVASHAGQGRQAPQRELGVVDSDRIALMGHHLGSGLAGAGDVDRGLFDAGADVFALGFVKGAKGATQGDFIGDDVLTVAAVDRTEGNHCRVLHDVELARHQGLHAHYDLGAGNDRVGTEPGHGAVGLAALDLDEEVIG